MKITTAVTAVSLAVAAGAAQATVVNVYNPSGTASHVGAGTVQPDALAGDAWARRNLRDGSSIGISTTYARSGNGSAFFSGANGTSKADYEYIFSDPSGQTLANLTSLSYEWYRDSASTAPAHFHPALRLYVDADGNMATTNDRGYLIYERAYNPSVSAVPTDTWTTESIGGSTNLWLRQFTPGQTEEVYNRDLNDIINGYTATPGFMQLSGNSLVFGLSVGIGSGWAGSYIGAMDNVSIGFGGNDPTTFNFEVIPSPMAAGFALGGMALVGGLRRRRGV